MTPLPLTLKSPKHWTSYSFKVNFRGTIITVQVNQSSVKVKTDCESKLIVLINGDQLTVSNKEPKTIQL
jgi:maltose phosphorylase